MTDFLVRRFVRDSENTESTEVRTRYGILASVVGIFCNVFLFAAKLIIGTLMHALLDITNHKQIVLPHAAYQAVNTLLVQRNWLIGYRIAEEELGGDERSEYGLEVIKKISKELTQRYGKGYDRSNLYHCLKFYKTFPEIVDTACRQSGVLLSWSHYRTLLQVKDPEARDWYEKEAAEQTWSVCTLQRNISS